MGILAAEVAGGALGPHSRSAVGEANGGARFLRRFASYQGIARRKISLLCNDVIRNVHCLQQALTRLGVIRRFTRLAPLRLAAAGLTSGCPAFNLLELLRLHFRAGGRRLDLAMTLTGGARADAAPSRFVPYLVGRSLPGPYHLRARIQSFQAFAAPFAGESARRCAPRASGGFPRALRTQREGPTARLRRNRDSDRARARS